MSSGAGGIACGVASFALPTNAEGVLPGQMLEAAIVAGVIGTQGADRIPRDNLQPASLDLRLGSVAYRMRSSFLPDRHTVIERMGEHLIDELSLTGRGAVLETNRPYLIPLKECLDLPPTVRGKANPKSSTGRLDIFTRVITDRGRRFDEVRAGYRGPLYLEVVPLSFAVRVSEGLTLSQLRLAIGKSELSDEEIAKTHAKEPLLVADGRPLPAPELELSNGLFMGLGLSATPGARAGYRARDNAPLLDLTRPGPLDPSEYWEEVRVEQGGRIILTPQRFYLLMSKESVIVPPGLAAEMTAYDPTSGELRTHYAGFFDPAFGYERSGETNGSRAALEVRAHEVPFSIEDGQKVCKLTFERMLEEPERLYGSESNSSYQGQQEALGKHFLSGAARNAGTGIAG